MLRWSNRAGDARRSACRRDVQPFAAVPGQAVPVVSRKAESSTGVHARPTWRACATSAGGCRRASPVIVRRLLGDGERFVYAYYDGIDKIAHEHGLGDFYDAELRPPIASSATCRRCCRPTLRCWSPPTTARSTSASGSSRPTPRCWCACRYQSGEGRFRWLHARPGAAADLYDAAKTAHGDVAWVVTRAGDAGRRLVRARGRPADRPPDGRRGAGGARSGQLRRSRPTPGRSSWCARHGSLTSAEMLVPLLAGRSGPHTLNGRDEPPPPIRTEIETMSDQTNRAARWTIVARCRRTAGGGRAGGAHGRAPAAEEVRQTELVSEPAKVMRIGSMVKQLLDEVRAAPLDDRSRERLAEIYENSIDELSTALSPDLQEELKSLALPFDGEGVPSDAELRVAQAQLVGWLEGLFHGIQATLLAQQFAARQQLEQMRQLPPASLQGVPGGVPGRPGGAPDTDRPGTYL